MAIKDNNWKSYNDAPLKDGEVLVPQLVSKEVRNGPQGQYVEPENVGKKRHQLSGDVHPGAKRSGEAGMVYLQC